MSNRRSAIVICHSRLMQDAIARSLESHDFDIDARSCLDAAENGRTRQSADVGIIISSLYLDDINQTVSSLLDISVSNWIVMAQSLNDPVAHALMQKGLSVCVIPDDIDGKELVHVAILASYGSKVSLGRFCGNNPTTDLQTIANADLDTGQWRLLMQLAEGHTNKMIARAEDASETAIKARIRSLLIKLGVENRTQAAVMAARAGLRITGEMSDHVLHTLKPKASLGPMLRA